MGSVEWAWALVGQGHLFSFIFFVRRVGQLLGRGSFFGLFFVRSFCFYFRLLFILPIILYIYIEKQISHKTFEKMLTKHLKILHVYKENDYHMYKNIQCVWKKLIMYLKMLIEHLKNVKHVYKNVNQAFENVKMCK